MGPIIILDKSVLQSLSFEEIKFLRRHYLVNIVPVLVIEILGNLKKYADDEARSQDIVKQHADKFSPLDSVVNGSYQVLVTASLLGAKFEMDGRPIVTGAISFTDSNGDRGVVVDERPEEEALRRWREGQFTEAEKTLAQRWRDVTRSLDLKGFRTELLKANTDIPKVKTLDELKVQVDNLLSAESSQLFYLQWLIARLNLPFQHTTAIVARWNIGRFTSLRHFAPYAFHCLRVETAFMLGLMHGVMSGMIAARPTNRVDLEYLFYLPFCHVFSSGDNFQGPFCKLFLADYQQFIPASDLKTDLHNIATAWKALTEDEQKAQRREYSCYPPVNATSFTHQMWLKHMKPWRPGRHDVQISPEQERVMLERARAAQAALKGKRDKTT